MAQVSMTVRMDAAVKAQFDSLCSQFGMSANTAMNIFANAVVQRKEIPFTIKIVQGKKENPGLEAFYALREEAKNNGLQEMTLDEINEEIRLAREERTTK